MGLANVYWLLFVGHSLKKLPKGPHRRNFLWESFFGAELGLPILAWLVLAYLAAIAGVNPPRAFAETAKTTFWMLSPFAVAASLSHKILSGEQVMARLRSYFHFLLFTQSITSFHSVISASLGTKLSLGIPGAVTESGQLAVLIPCILAFLFIEKQVSDKQQSLTSSPRSKELFIWSVGLCFLVAALIVNLKRGPWFGVFLTSLIFGVLASKRTALITLCFSCAVLALAIPVQERLAASLADFSIHGGRETMWALGVELISLYPLGLGADNAIYMRTLYPSLPSTHQHMHNNILNVTAETGLLGGCCFIWIIFAAIQIGFRIWRRNHTDTHSYLNRSFGFLGLGFALSVLSWQTSGLVEYNFGDGEVRLMALAVMGTLLALTRVGKVQK